MHKKKAGIAFVGMGAVLILSALLLFLYNEYNNAMRENEVQNIYRELQSMIQPSSSTPLEAMPSSAQDALNCEEIISETDAGSDNMKVVMLHGYTYIGILEIPVLGLALPILSDWDDEKLEIAPCRQFGSNKTGDLVIAGHNYRRHFLNLYKLNTGDMVRFTDMEGDCAEYTVEKKQTLQETDVEAVVDSTYEMVLYTCTYSGKERTAVFCRLKQDEGNSQGIAAD